MGLILKPILYKAWDQMLCYILGLYFDRSVVFTLMVLLGLICISLLGVRSSCLCMFFMFVNGEKLIPHFNLVFLLFFWFFLFWEERDIKWV